ncbi:MAG: protein kinase [Myxococcales bacterium]|nr:protein kinase [Myxococcales bacterium]
MVPQEYAEAFTKRGFALKSTLGSGLSGTVYRATQTSLDRDVALKIFDNPLSERDAALRKRFEREARLLARIVHPAIPVVLTRGEISIGGKEIPYTVLQLIDGDALAKVIESERRLDLQRAANIAVRVLGALNAAHAQQIVHRDVKPSNIMVQPLTGQVYLIDFSIGVSLDGSAGLTRVTDAAGGQPGSFEYMAPEQKAGRDIDHRADIYSLGVVLFEMLAGHPRVNLSALDSDLPHVPTEARELIRTACQHSRDARFENAEAFLRGLEPHGTSRRSRATPGIALCVNFKCREARWTERGYYEGPRVLEDTTSNYCPDCGSALIYPCERCSKPFAYTQFCANCGTKLYDVPECRQCGSWLTAKDMDTDTAETGCEKCRRKRSPTATGGIDAMGDDIPF